jgi:hypothetical protein
VRAAAWPAGGWDIALPGGGSQTTLILWECVGLGDGERLRPGGVLLAWLVTGAGLVLAAGDELAPGEGRTGEWDSAGDGRVAGFGADGAVPASPEVCALAEAGLDVPASRPDQGMNEPPGPPSRPTAITARHASKVTPAPRPSRRIRRRRRPEMSANTGAGSADWYVERGRFGISDRQTAPSLNALHGDGERPVSGRWHAGCGAYPR